MKTSGGVVYPRTVPRKKVVHVLPKNADSNVPSRRQAGESSFESWREALSSASPPLASAETINALYERRLNDQEVRMANSTSITSPIRSRPNSGARKRVTDKLHHFLSNKVQSQRYEYTANNYASEKRDAALGKLNQQLHAAHDEHVRAFKGVAAAELFAPVENPASETICLARGYLATVCAAWHGAQVRSIEKLNEVSSMREQQREANARLREQCSQLDMQMRNIVSAIHGATGADSNRLLADARAAAEALRASLRKPLTDRDGASDPRGWLQAQWSPSEDSAVHRLAALSPFAANSSSSSQVTISPRNGSPSASPMSLVKPQVHELLQQDRAAAPVLTVLQIAADTAKASSNPHFDELDARLAAAVQSFSSLSSKLNPLPANVPESPASALDSKTLEQDAQKAESLRQLRLRRQQLRELLQDSDHM